MDLSLGEISDLPEISCGSSKYLLKIPNVTDDYFLRQKMYPV